MKFLSQQMSLGDRSRVVAAFLAIAPFAAVLAIQEPEGKVSFSRQVAPIMRAHCTSCHGTKSPAANLDLSSLNGILKGGIGGTSAVGGDPSKSSLLQRALGHGNRPRMPLGFAPLKAEQVSILERWIKEGAKADVGKATHWAYIPPSRPEVPQVKNARWVRNPIDAFALAKLERLGLKPSAEAGKEMLIRRVYLDLTGLPPTVGEVDAFLGDKRADAYERIVDRLFASPHYGERQARFWLDLARYADTDGFADLPRNAWKYRDWVIKAFNENMPYDQFTIEQLAGDLLPPGDFDRLIATGFHRNSMFDAEMGGDPEEAHLNVIADRVSTTSTVWLGSTLQCARCHDHKYDPFSQKDFYAMAAFFNGTSSKPTNPGEKRGRWVEPVLPLPTAKQVSIRQKLSQKVEFTERTMKKWSPEKREAMAQWRERVKNPTWIAQNPSLESFSGAKFQRLEDGSFLVSGPLIDEDRYRINMTGQSGRVTGVRIELIPDPSLPKKGSGRAHDGLAIITRVALALDGKKVRIGAAAADYSGEDFPASNLTSDEDNDGWSAEGEVDKPHELVLGFEKPAEISPASKLVLDVYQEDQDPSCKIGRFRISLATTDHPTSWIAPADVKALFDKSPLSKKEQEALDNAFFAASPLFGAERKAVAAAKKDLAKLDEAIPSAMILQEHAGKEPLKIPLRVRGEFPNKGPDVFADTPSVLPVIERKGRVDRLALAYWLVAKENPLTARVLANRLWEQSFGRGIVETSEDFGIRGSIPTHPELLDWMALKLQNGWNVKAMQRLIVTSSTYRQTSRTSKEALAHDAKNLLLARGPKVRMDAETIRDASLAYGGLLFKKIGGPSVFPYQPAEATENNADWEISHGPDAYRRSLYTFLQRGYPFPMFQLFDATSRSECTVRRVNTMTPLQALALLNDRGMTEAAEGLGRRMMGAGKTDDARLAFGFRTCTSRRPSSAELRPLNRLLVQLRQKYSVDLKSAMELSGTPERSAWTMVGNVLLNMDEAINRN
ncbi:MAG: DUF1549 domain-containing protein [Chlorobia bacterium]|nr:DUF1549 domain-containing protein [Fimbriimonadaceae bacterium]